MRRATAPLSDLQIRTASKGTRFELADGEVPGLGLRVLPSGRKFWFLRTARVAAGVESPSPSTRPSV
jgi:hypothetical protein